MPNSHRFFSNKDCMYHPCHELPTDGDFNCLFCYCPLYSHGRDCGGIFSYSKDGLVKLCMDCHLPHEPEFYDEVMRILTNGV